MASLPLTWLSLIADINGRSYIGQPGVRDPEAPCDQYEPAYPTAHGLGLRWAEPRAEEATGSCMTDGHYLCVECPHIARENLVERGFFAAPDEVRHG